MPRVVDRDGNELRVGDRVRSPYGVAEVTGIEEGDYLIVRIETLASRRGVKFTAAPTMCDPNPGYSVGRLERLDTQQEGGSDG